MKNIALLLLTVFATGTVQAAGTHIPEYAGGSYSVPVMSLKEARFKTTIRQQYDFSCGSAAVATLLTYQYGYPINEQTVFEEMYAHGDQKKIQKEGFSLLDMKLFLEAHGFDADGFELPLDQLLAAKLPAIVLISEQGYHHFVVVKGVLDGRVLIGDPAMGTRAMSRSSFEAVWDNRVLFVIHNKQGLAKFNNPLDWSVAPRAPISMGVNRDGLWNVTMPKHGPSDF